MTKKCNEVLERFGIFTINGVALDECESYMLRRVWELRWRDNGYVSDAKCLAIGRVLADRHIWIIVGSDKQSVHFNHGYFPEAEAANYP